MNTIAIYRAKLVLIRYTIVCAILLTIMVIGTVNLSHTHVSFTTDANGLKHTQSRDVVQPNQTIPLDGFLAIVGFGGLVVASALAGNLSRERSYLALVWTRPRTRTNEALTTIGIDFATILVADIVLFALAEIALQITDLLSGGHIQIALLGARATADASPAGDALATLAAVLGASVMWYGVVAACTAPFAKAALSWIAWPVFLVLGAFYGSHALRVFGLDPLVQALMYLNPMAYFPGSNALPTFFAWLIAALGCAAAVYGWSRKELTR